MQQQKEDEKVTRGAIFAGLNDAIRQFFVFLLRKRVLLHRAHARRGFDAR